MPSATGWSGSSAKASAARPLDDPAAIRHAGAELLSLALIDGRNGVLALLALDESPAALRLAARAGWYQEWWIARHVQRGRGEAADPHAARLAGIEPRIEAWLSPQADAPSPEALRGYLAETLEITLDLLAALPPQQAGDGTALYVYRAALRHEDRIAEQLTERLRLGQAPARAEREPLWLPAQRWRLGSEGGEGDAGSGLVPHNERWAHEVAVPEFEIDAQPVNWARYVEFADDGGYDRRELWSDVAWDWLQAEARRAPGGVEQLHGGVLVSRGVAGGGGLQRAAPSQPAVHVSRHEAEAWCRWAGRRLPTEPEWELAAERGSGRGFAWGDLHEWVAGSARGWPGAGPVPPGEIDPVPPAGSGLAVLRGASFATRSRWRHAKARRFAAPASDTVFCGFRSCAL